MNFHQFQKQDKLILQINFNKSKKDFCGHLVHKILSLVVCVLVNCMLCYILMACEPVALICK